MSECLSEPMLAEFVGGPEDGRRLTVSEGLHVLRVPVAEPFSWQEPIGDSRPSFTVQTWEVVGINDDGVRRLMRIP